MPAREYAIALTRYTDVRSRAGIMDIDHLGGEKRRAQHAIDARVQRIAVVDDDEPVRRLLRNVFEAGGFAVTEVRNEAELMAALKSYDIALITLDLSLRHEDGLAIARTVRSFSDIPIVMVTARAEDVDRIVGLELGADDYIVKPFNVREVLARVRAVLRRTRHNTMAHQTMAHQTMSHRAPRAGATGPDSVQFGTWIFDLAARELRAEAGGVTPLTTAEFKMLQAFVSHAGRVLSRDMLLDLAGGLDAVPMERSVDTIVSRLRRKIESDAGDPQFIKTVRGAGYIFTAKLRS